MMIITTASDGEKYCQCVMKVSHKIYSKSLLPMLQTQHTV